MGCFLACFGYSKNRKRLKPSNKVPSRYYQRHGSYQPLDSNVTIKLDIIENPIVSDSGSSKKGKERLSLKPKKKVSFNLNVLAYEPLPNDETINYFSENEEEEKNAKEGISLALSKEDSFGSYPSNYRYQNCRDSYDEEDKIELEESDLDDDDIDEDEDEEDEDYDDVDGVIREEFSGQFDSMRSEKWVTFSQLASEKYNNFMPVSASLDQEQKKLELNQNARCRSEYMHPVLNPVENLTQWKAIKSRTAKTLKHHQKENIKLEQEQSMPIVNLSPVNCKTNFDQSKPLMQDIAVDASLSNWLVSSEKGKITKNSDVTIIGMSSKENIFGRSKFSK